MEDTGIERKNRTVRRGTGSRKPNRRKAVDGRRRKDVWEEAVRTGVQVGLTGGEKNLDGLAYLWPSSGPQSGCVCRARDQRT